MLVKAPVNWLCHPNVRRSEIPHGPFHMGILIIFLIHQIVFIILIIFLKNSRKKLKIWHNVVFSSFLRSAMLRKLGQKGQAGHLACCQGMESVLARHTLLSHSLGLCLVPNTPLYCQKHKHTVFSSKSNLSHSATWLTTKGTSERLFLSHMSSLVVQATHAPSAVTDRQCSPPKEGSIAPPVALRLPVTTFTQRLEHWCACVTSQRVLRTVKNPGNWLTTINLNTYVHIPIYPPHIKSLRLAFQMVISGYLVLQFSLSKPLHVR